MTCGKVGLRLAFEAGNLLGEIMDLADDDLGNHHSITTKFINFKLLYMAEVRRVKHPTTTEFPIQAYLTKQHCPEKHIAFEILILKNLSRLAVSGRNTLKYLKRATIHAGCFLAAAVAFIQDAQLHNLCLPDNLR